MSGHTPTPWVWRDMGGWKLMTERQGALIVLGAGGVRKSQGPPPPAKLKLRDQDRCLLVDFDPQHPDAEFIVRACNAHEELLAACRAMVSAYETVVSMGGSMATFKRHFPDAAGVGYAAIEKAGRE